MPNYRYGKPVIGLAGGIGSGKSFVAQALAAQGCGIIDSDAVAHQVLSQPEVAAQLAQWWGPLVLNDQGLADRKKIAQRVFNDQASLNQLNGLIHPAVQRLREERSMELGKNPAIRAIVWDTPLLYETGLNRDCDAVIFVKAPYEQRLARVAATRHWTQEQLKKRENLQISLDNKEKLADYVLDNSGQEAQTLRHLHQILSQILSNQA